MRNFLMALLGFLKIKKSPLVILGKKFLEFLLETLGGKLSELFEKTHSIANEAVLVIEEFEKIFISFQRIGKILSVDEVTKELEHVTKLTKIAVNFNDKFNRLIALLRMIDELKAQLELSNDTDNLLDECYEHLEKLKKEKRNLKQEISEEIIEKHLKENGVNVDYSVIRTCVSLAVVRMINNSEK